MIVGVKSIDLDDLLKHCRNVKELRKYSDSLVPRVLSHREEIIYNQRYIVALHLRYLDSLPYCKVAELTEGLLEGVSLTGVINEIYDYSDLLTRVNIEELCLLIGEQQYE